MDLSKMIDSIDSSLNWNKERVLGVLNEKGYNTEDLKDFLFERGNLLALSPAGSGKTVSIILKLLTDYTLGYLSKLVEKNGMVYERDAKVLVSTFSKTGANDLSQTLHEESKKTGLQFFSKNARFSTLHSCFYDIIKKIGVDVRIVDGNTQMNLVRDICVDFHISNGYPSVLELQAILGMFSYLNNQLEYIDGTKSDKVYQKALANAVLEAIGITEASLVDTMYRSYQAKKKELGVLDFDDLQILLYRYGVDESTRNKNITKLLENLFDYIIIDEFQDVSQVQYEILKVMGRKAQMIAVGDEDQSIYSFRGSNIDIIMNQYPKDFSPNIYRFKYSYRCPKNITSVAKNVIDNNTNRYEKDIVGFKDGGEVCLYQFNSYKEMLESSYIAIIQELNKGKSVAVLGGMNFDFQPLAVYLDSKNMTDMRIGGTLGSLTKSKFSNVYKVLSLLEVGCNLETVMRTWRLGIPNYVLRKLSRELLLHNISPLQFPIEDYYSIDANLGKVMEEFIKVYNNAVEDGLSVAETMNHLLRRMAVLMYNKVIPSKNDIEIVSNTIICILDTYGSKIESYEDFLKVVKKVDNNLKGYSDKDKANLILTTIHDFKGLEADVVFGFNLVEGSLPRLPVLQIPSESLREESIEEERRLFYILTTRAREKIVFCTYRGINIVPSRFINELKTEVSSFIRPLEDVKWDAKYASDRVEVIL